MNLKDILPQYSKESGKYYKHEWNDLKWGAKKCTHNEKSKEESKYRSDNTGSEFHKEKVGKCLFCLLYSINQQISKIGLNAIKLKQG